MERVLAVVEAARMRNVRRYYVPGQPVFITQVCAGRAPRLADPARKQVVLDALLELHAAGRLRLLAYAILDDHLHLLALPRDGEFSTPMRSFKLRVLRRIGGDHRGRAAAFWQPRFHDHVCRNDGDVARHVDYIHYNPVRHDYVARAGDYAMTSLAAWIRAGRRERGWGDSEPAALPPGNE
jgi:putative transposase